MVIKNDMTTAICLECGEGFFKKRRDQIFCETPCRTNFFWKRKTAKMLIEKMNELPEDWRKAVAFRQPLTDEVIAAIGGIFKSEVAGGISLIDVIASLLHQNIIFANGKFTLLDISKEVS